ncbi:unnamed protein product [Diamesa serratosioi]
MENEVKKPFLIGVAGGTASGKSTVCKRIIEKLGQAEMNDQQRQVVSISQDSFYRELTEEEKAKAAKGRFNFDHPDAFDENLMLVTLTEILAGNKTTINSYDYRTNSLCPNKPITIYPADVVLFEGILVFYFQSIRDLFHMKLFVDTDSDTRLARRVPRDINERGRDLDQVLSQYMQFVKPAFEEFCSPTKKFADVIIPRGADNTVAIDLIVQHIRDFLSDRLSLESLTLSPTTTPSLSNVHNVRGGKMLLSTQTNASTVEPREAYFNGSAYLRLRTPMTLWGHSAISFRTCRGGEILSQSYSKHKLIVTVLKEGISVSLNSQQSRTEARVAANLLDNHWHTIQFLYQLGNLNLIIDRKTFVISNSTYKKELISDQEIKNEAAVLILGNQYSGCLLHGPGLVFNTSEITVQGVLFGSCPLAPGICHPDHDVLIREPIDHCQNFPCMHGQCISRPDEYQCHCTARYGGKNCEVDNGAPCLAQPCQNGATCLEDTRGDFKCFCAPGFTGKMCDIEFVTQPLCEKSPCLNNGTCRASANSKVYECDCADGFQGKNCEIDFNDCESAPCQNNGRCFDEAGGFTCDCKETGYTGLLCQNNIDECMQHNPCLNNGICFDNYGSYTCECSVGFGGPNCETIISECQSQPCLSGGTCIDREKGNFECKCLSGYGGKLCEISPQCPQCPRDSECFDGKCVCKNGKTGVVGHCIALTTSMPTSSSPRKSAKTNACSSYCKNGASCVGNVDTNVTCVCSSGFTGLSFRNRCESPMALPFQDECSCMNGGTCIQNSSTDCICPAGYDGKHCEHEVSVCLGDNCSCQSSPCLNDGSCNPRPGTSMEYDCQCKSGYNGTNCEKDIDECKENAKICGHGICVNTKGNFQCYCEPGFTGKTCDLDVDECLSVPCQHNAKCINKVNDFECICAPGYMGKECEIEIDECASNPCYKGSTCKDLVADYSCICIFGMTGRHCEIDIDECESSPCQNLGVCMDELGGYHCNCTGTGYTGNTCQMNIDECESSPCVNGALCEDRVNDYYCKCFNGYDGKNCEGDINECEENPCKFHSTCLERSNQTLYQLSAIEKHSLPYIFSKKFSYENASGYECICVTGTKGINCEININECDSNPCKNGACVDGIGNYTCDCEPGFEGIHCEDDIDECLYKPCQHGTCIDGRNNYICDCDALYGGKNCSVPLTGCLSSPCLNNGSCIPYLEDETEHKFNCSCQNGYQGETCEKTTTMSLEDSSLLTVNTNRNEGYDIQLRFKTTLPNGILAFGTAFGSPGNPSPYSYILELVNGKLNLHSSLLNKWEGVFIGSGLNDSEWHKVFVTINSSHLVLSANEEQTIYPINSYEGTNASHTSFPVTYLGGTIPNLSSYLRHLTNHVAPSSFVGCMEDVVINGQWVLPDEKNSYVNLTKVKTGCPREAQCDPNPCNSNGHCTDLWHTFKCVCQRPHLGKTCKYNITTATFGHENTTRSAVVVNVSDIARRAIRSILDISMFIRTRQSTGQVFYLGSDPQQTAGPNGEPREQTSISATLNKGELYVHMRFNGTPETYAVGGKQLDDGFNHLIEVIRNSTLVQVKLNGTEYFRKTLSTTGQLNAQVLYLGALPPQIDPDEDKKYFKGLIQDVQVSNGSHAMMVELYPLETEEGLTLPPPFGRVTIDRDSVLKGEVSDDLCRGKPCQHDAVCTNTWNDFSCNCTRGYKGKFCQDIQFCELQTCPGDSKCQNLDDGYDCITNMTFQGNQDTPLQYNFVPKSTEDDEIKPFEKIIEIAYRTKFGGTLMYVEDESDMYFQLAAYKDQLTVQWRLSSDLPEPHRFTRDKPDGFDWNVIYLRVADNKLEAGWKGWETMVDPQPLISVPIDMGAFDHLFSGKYPISLGGMDQSRTNFIQLNEKGASFKGCIGETRVDGHLLPFFPYEEIYDEKFRARAHFSLNSTKPEEGCILCFEQDCKNGGMCRDPTGHYACDCLLGYERDDCSQNIDECLLAECQNNSTCVDGIGSYKCDCLPGYEGVYCEHEINECQSDPCHNGGNCTDLIATFECACTEDYAGKQCDVLRLVTCDNVPCKTGSTCMDGFNSTTGNNFTCLCTVGYQGALCDLAFCVVDPCKNEGICLNDDKPECKCQKGYNGRYCELDIDECAVTPCLNNGKCSDLIGDFDCDCSGTGFTGKHCEVDIDECLTEAISCGGRGQCLNTIGSFKCQCNEGMCGPDCNLVDPCIENDHICSNDGNCIEICSTHSDYRCECSDGFIGKNCTEVASVSSGPSTADIAIIVIPIVVILLAICGATLAAFLIMARNKRATRGTYSPSAQEYCNPRLEMDNVLKPPPEERLI